MHQEFQFYEFKFAKKWHLIPIAIEMHFTYLQISAMLDYSYAHVYNTYKNANPTPGEFDQYINFDLNKLYDRFVQHMPLLRRNAAPIVLKAIVPLGDLMFKAFETQGVYAHMKKVYNECMITKNQISSREPYLPSSFGALHFESSFQLLATAIALGYSAEQIVSALGYSYGGKVSAYLRHYPEEKRNPPPSLEKAKELDEALWKALKAEYLCARVDPNGKLITNLNFYGDVIKPLHPFATHLQRIRRKEPAVKKVEIYDEQDPHIVVKTRRGIILDIEVTDPGLSIEKEE